jgi:hypothetical protein
MWRKKLKNEIGRSILLEDPDKQFWIRKSDTLPELLIKNLYGVIRKQNLLAEKYIRIAIKKNPKLLSVLKNKIKSVKTKTLKLEESKNAVSAEEELAEQLGKI